MVPKLRVNLQGCDHVLESGVRSQQGLEASLQGRLASDARSAHLAPVRGDFVGAAANS